MNINMFDFDLPQELIGQSPCINREESKMMVLNREKSSLEHKNFYNICDYFEKDEVLVLNDTKVISARVRGINSLSKGKMEFLFLKTLGNNLWEVMCKPGKRALVNREFICGKGKLKVKIKEIKEDGHRIVELDFDKSEDLYSIIEEIGEMPLPPYIKESLNDKERYQTVYSNKLGSIAAPTAGLHFTKDILNKLKEKGVKIVYTTLHVGLGTFLPVKTHNIDEHKMHSEYYELSLESANVINMAKRNNKRVVAVGTTSVRVLETIASKSNDNLLFPSSGYTDIFIKPGYEFKIVDSLITNFHLPKSTLLMLVSAFYNREKIMEAYKEAINNKYRFFSFGDSMYII